MSDSHCWRSHRVEEWPRCFFSYGCSCVPVCALVNHPPAVCGLRAYLRIGNALWKMDKLEEALEAYNQSLTEFRTKPAQLKKMEVCVLCMYVYMCVVCGMLRWIFRWILRGAFDSSLFPPDMSFISASHSLRSC